MVVYYLIHLRCKDECCFLQLQTEVKVEASAVKQLLEEGVGVDEGEEVGLLHPGHAPIMIRGEDGVLYQVWIP